MTLSIVVSDSLEPLADQLAVSLAKPLDDPMQAELVAVPSAGLQRWLKLYLAGSLGAANGQSGGVGDGIAANIDMPFPGVLRSRLFSSERADGDDDPWALSSLVWTVLDVLLSNQDDPALARIVTLPEGATWYGRARRIADLFDRYGARRTDLLRRWLRNDNSDPTGQPLPPDLLWQPHLFRLVDQHIGVPSPAERLPDLLARAADGQSDLSLPPRLAIFGVSTLPGGQDFADLLKALGKAHDIDLYMLDPAPGTSARLRAQFAAEARLLRSDDVSGLEVRQPLLTSWGRPSREAQLLVQRLGLPEVQVARAERADAPGLLGVLQRHIRSDAAAEPSHHLDPGDRSIELHECVGPTRQVEVLRDTLLHALAQDPDLEESDILVVSPDLETFAPIIEGVFGPTADRWATHWQGPTRLRYTISDRGLQQNDSLTSALSALVGLVGGRYNASEVLDFCRLGPVADAFGFDSDAIAQIDGWLDATEVRWGLDEQNRNHNGLRNLTTNTWHHGLRQLLVGMAIQDDDPALGPESIPPWGVESGGVEVLNRLLALFSRLRAVEREWSTAAPIADWSERLSDAIGSFFEVPFNEQWQVERTRSAIDQAADLARIGGGGESLLSITEIRQLLDERLSARSARPRFFDGAVTFTSLRPLRWVRFKMICVLGLDEAALASSVPNGDDLLAAKPDIGDPERRADQRQSLLELVLSAQQRLVLVRTGQDVRSNTPVPPSVVVSELFGELASLVTEDSDRSLAALVTQHPRHGFDPKNFDGTEPRSFDKRALRAAVALGEGRLDEGITPMSPSGAAVSVSAQTLAEVIVHAPKFFYRTRLGASFWGQNEGTSDNLPIIKDNLQDWQTLTDMLALLTDGGSIDDYVEILRRRGAYPAGEVGARALSTLSDIAIEMNQRLKSLTEGHRIDSRVSATATVEGVDIVASIDQLVTPVGLGPIRTTASTEDARLLYPLWVQLCVQTLHDGSQRWRAVAASKNKKPTKKNSGPVNISMFSLRGASSDDRAAVARRVLRSMLELRQLGMTEPLPIIAKVDVKTSGSITYLDGWESGMFPGPMDDPYVLAAYGRIPDSELLSFPPRSSDPRGPNGQLRSRFLQLRSVIEDLWESSMAPEVVE